MQAGVDFIIMYIHESNQDLTFDMTGKVRYQQESSNQRNKESTNCYLLMTFY